MLPLLSQQSCFHHQFLALLLTILPCLVQKSCFRHRFSTIFLRDSLGESKNDVSIILFKLFRLGSSLASPKIVFESSFSTHISFFPKQHKWAPRDTGREIFPDQSSHVAQALPTKVLGIGEWHGRYAKNRVQISLFHPYIRFFKAAHVGPTGHRNGNFSRPTEPCHPSTAHKSAWGGGRTW